MHDSVTSNTIDAIAHLPQRQALPLESTLSLPIPISRNGRVALAFFWTSQGGPSKARVVSGPYCRTIVDPALPGEATFERLACDVLDIPSDAPPLSPTIGQGVPANERKAFTAHFHALTDRLLTIYADERVGPSAESSEVLAAYRRTFDRQAVIALRPAYRALSPLFFAWLEAHAPLVVVPQAGDVYAIASGDGGWSVAKILDVEPDAVHARLYRDRFAMRPLRVDTTTLTISSGHVPLVPDWFDAWDAELLAREAVSERELDGYRSYRTARDLD